MRISPVLLCLWIVIAVAPARAQFEYGEILGTVRDSSGAVLLHAKVTVRGLDTNIEASTLTNEQGNYSFPDLRSGNYEVTAAVTGFRPAKSDALALRVGDRLRTDLTLEPGLITGEVTVQASVAPAARNRHQYSRSGHPGSANRGVALKQARLHTVGIAGAGLDL